MSTVHFQWDLPVERSLFQTTREQVNTPEEQVTQSHMVSALNLHKFQSAENTLPVEHSQFQTGVWGSL
jgi:hypothetical protein